MPFEAGKTYHTRNGDVARIYATDGEQPYPLHGAIQGVSGWEINTWTLMGRFYHGKESISGHDLILPDISPDEHRASVLNKAREVVADLNPGTEQVDALTSTRGRD
jgi:hypothetical protein